MYYISPFCTFSDHVSSHVELSKALNRLGESAIVRDDEPDDIGTAFQNFSVIINDLSNIMKTLVRQIQEMDSYFSKISVSPLCVHNPFEALMPVLKRRKRSS